MMIDILLIILIIFGVLQIILFFKLWGMTNDIKEIKNKYIEGEHESKTTDEKTIVEINKASKPMI